MRLDVLTGNLPNSDAIDTHAQRRLAFALDRFASRIEQVRVRLGDLNGPRGGVDKRCAVECDLGRLGSVVIEEVDDDLYTAIDRACHPPQGRRPAQARPRQGRLEGPAPVSPPPARYT